MEGREAGARGMQGGPPVGTNQILAGAGAHGGAGPTARHRAARRPQQPGTAPGSPTSARTTSKAATPDLRRAKAWLELDSAVTARGGIGRGGDVRGAWWGAGGLPATIAGTTGLLPPPPHRCSPARGSASGRRCSAATPHRHPAAGRATPAAKEARRLLGARGCSLGPPPPQRCFQAPSGRPTHLGKARGHAFGLPEARPL